MTALKKCLSVALAVVICAASSLGFGRMQLVDDYRDAKDDVYEQIGKFADWNDLSTLSTAVRSARQSGEIDALIDLYNSEAVNYSSWEIEDADEEIQDYYQFMRSLNDFPATLIADLFDLELK